MPSPYPTLKRRAKYNTIVTASPVDASFRWDGQPSVSVARSMFLRQTSGCAHSLVDTLFLRARGCLSALPYFPSAPVCARPDGMALVVDGGHHGARFRRQRYPRLEGFHLQRNRDAVGTDGGTCRQHRLV
jgi:hypothetical protein